MASPARAPINSYIPTKKKAGTFSEAQDARRELLNDLMGDAKKCLATKNKTQRKALALAIKKIAES
jgi:hypothetical protein